MKNRSISLAIYFGLVSMLTTVAPALASSSSSTSGPLHLDNVTGVIDQIVQLATGPVAKLVAIVAVIGGAVAFSQGREMNEGMKNLGLVAICIGLLIGATSLIGTLGATI